MEELLFVTHLHLRGVSGSGARCLGKSDSRSLSLLTGDPGRLSGISDPRPPDEDLTTDPDTGRLSALFDGDLDRRFGDWTEDDALVAVVRLASLSEPPRNCSRGDLFLLSSCKVDACRFWGGLMSSGERLLPGLGLAFSVDGRIEVAVDCLRDCGNCSTGPSTVKSMNEFEIF